MPRSDLYLPSRKFRFRNAVAHGKNESWVELVDAKDLLEFVPGGTRPRTEWEEACTPATIQRWMKAIEKIIRFVQSATGVQDPPPWNDSCCDVYKGASCWPTAVRSASQTEKTLDSFVDRSRAS